MDQAVKQILNSLHCPLCKSQIDIRSYPNNSKGEFNYACALDLNHYQIYLATNNVLEDPFIHYRSVSPFIEKEKVIILEEGYMFEITQYNRDPNLNNSRDTTQIVFFNIDEENRVVFFRGKERSPLFKISKLFDFQQTTREKIIKRINTILTFQ